MKKYCFIALASLLVLVSGGCSTYKGQSKEMMAAWKAGDVSNAVVFAGLKAARACGGKDELLWKLEQGTVLSADGNYDGGIQAFDRAEEIVNRYEEAAKIKVADETVALFSNPATMPYRGRDYDKVLMNTYKALNYLAVNDADNARVELNRALQRQKNAVAENQKRIEKTLEAAEKSGQGTLRDPSSGQAAAYDVGRAQQDVNVAASADAMMAAVDQRILPYADYVNPFSVFLDGLFFSHLGTDGADVERARKSFERVKGMSPGNYIAADYEMAEKMTGGADPETVTYIIFSTGRAPGRDQIRIDIPLFLLTDQASYVGAAFPKLEYYDDYIPQITATCADGRCYSSELLCSMDAVVSRDFKNEWPVMMTRTLLTTATRAIAGRLAEEVAIKNGNYMAQLAAKAANVSYQAAANVADLRSWLTLPKEFAYIRMPTPQNGEVTLKIGSDERTVHVPSGKTNVLIVRSVTPLSGPVLRQFTLNQE